jgi:1-acyl-sn-glycerol-3-phosphate acyltransferase
MTGGPHREAPRAPAGDSGGTLPGRSGGDKRERVGDEPDQSGEKRERGRETPDLARETSDLTPETPPLARQTPHLAPETPDLGRNEPGRRGNPDRGFLIAGAVVKPLMRVWFRIRVEGGEHVPREGPVILASNHRSNMDPVLLASALKRPVAFMAKAELFVGPLGWIMRWIGQFPVRRGGIDREALRRTDAVLARGSMLGLFPEGTRGDGGFAAVHPGLAYIVVRQRCPVLPVVIFGTERVRRRFGWLPFASPVRIVVGPAIDLPQSTSDRAGRRAASEVLRQRLQAFLVTAGGTPTSQAISSERDE